MVTNSSEARVRLGKLRLVTSHQNRSLYRIPLSFTRYHAGHAAIARNRRRSVARERLRQ